MKQRLPAAVTLAILIAACTDTESATDLNPAGPPMIQQVILVEAYTAPGDTTRRTRPTFAFGTHPEAFAEEVNSSAVAMAFDDGETTKVRLRIVMDELLVGNNLEEIQCRGPVDGDPFARIPLGATPSDIARCSNTDDTLPASCSASNPRSVCLCQIETGCFRGVTLVPRGQPVGVLDDNADGAADTRQLVAGSVGLRCGTIDVPLDLTDSYWNPSGNQNKPAMGGDTGLGRFSGLGPAVMLRPAGGVLPTSTTCSLVVSDEVVDKQGERVCTPPNGDIVAGCSPGDVSAFSFQVEPLAIGGPLVDGATGVDRMAAINFTSTAPVDPTTLPGITLVPAATFTVAIPPTNPRAIVITPTGGLAAMTMYTLTFPVTVRDRFGQPLPAAKVIRFTTGA